MLDGAHDAAGIEALVESLPAFLAGRRIVAVISVLEDKDTREMLAGGEGIVRATGSIDLVAALKRPADAGQGSTL